MLAQNARITDLALTTNGILFADQAEALKRAGLGRVTISLDTLRPDRFRQMTRRDEHHRVLSAFDAARRAGFTGTKLDAVIMRGENDDELADLIEFGRAQWRQRFASSSTWTCSAQPSGAWPRWSRAMKCCSVLSERYGKINTCGGNELGSRFTVSAARRHGLRNYCLHDFAFLPHLRSQPHNRGWDVVSLLYATSGTDLRKLLRGGRER